MIRSRISDSWRHCGDLNAAECRNSDFMFITQNCLNNLHLRMSDTSRVSEGCSKETTAMEMKSDVLSISHHHNGQIMYQKVWVMPFIWPTCPIRRFRPNEESEARSKLMFRTFGVNKKSLLGKKLKTSRSSTPRASMIGPLSEKLAQSRILPQRKMSNKVDQMRAFSLGKIEIPSREWLSIVSEEASQPVNFGGQIVRASFHLTFECSVLGMRFVLRNDQKWFDGS
jgi:hypothetical protein